MIGLNFTTFFHVKEEIEKPTNIITDKDHSKFLNFNTKCHKDWVTIECFINSPCIILVQESPIYLITGKKPDRKYIVQENRNNNKIIKVKHKVIKNGGKVP